MPIAVITLPCHLQPSTPGMEKPTVSPQRQTGQQRQSQCHTLSNFLMTSLKKWDKVAGSAMVA